MLGIEYPIFQGGMAWVADASLAAAVSNAGGLGLISAINAGTEAVRNEIRKCKTLTDKPFGVNIMLQAPNAEEIAHMVVEEGVTTIGSYAFYACTGVKELYILAAIQEGTVPCEFQKDGKGPWSIPVSNMYENVGTWDMIAKSNTCYLNRDEIAHLAFVSEEAQRIDADDRGVAACEVLNVRFGAVCSIDGHTDMSGVLMSEHYGVLHEVIRKDLQEFCDVFRSLVLKAH